MKKFWGIVYCSVRLGLSSFVLASCSLVMPDEVVQAESRSKVETKKLEKDVPDLSHFYKVGSTKMHFVEVASPEGKPLIIFVHGSPGSWKGWSRYLNDKDLRAQADMIAVDRPGFGQSNPGHAEKSLKAQGALLAPLLNRVKSNQKVILVGHSYGGPLVARLAIDYPERINHLIILAGSIDPALEETHWYQYPADWLVFTWMIPNDLLVCNREIIALKPSLKEMLPLWSKINQSVTVVQGMDDELVPPGNADFAQRVLVNARPVKFLRLEKVNHFIPWTNYDLVKKEILEKISKSSQ